LESETEPRKTCVVTVGRKNFLIAANFQLTVRQGKESNIAPRHHVVRVVTLLIITRININKHNKLNVTIIIITATVIIC
jgi:hypothetical protein